jgi:hypothetical protein
MSSRRKKPKQIVNVEQFAADAATMHNLIDRYAMGLHTGSDQYRAVADLHAALVTATELVLGRLPWARTEVQSNPQFPQASRD